MNENSLPVWDLSTIFSSPDGDDFKETLASIGMLCEKMKCQMRDGESLSSLISTYNELISRDETLSAYAEALLSTDTSNELYNRIQCEVEAMGVTVSEVDNLFLVYLRERQAEIASAENAQYRYVLEHMKRDACHRMSLPEETLASDLARSGSSAFARLFEAVTSSINYEGKTLTELRSDATAPERALRKASYEKEKKILQDASLPLSYALNGIKGSCLTIEARQGWKSPLEHSAFISRISMEALDALIRALEENLPVFREYFRIKARLLGLDKLCWYDVCAPVTAGKEEGCHYTFAQARRLVTQSFSAFDKGMGCFADSAFEKGWIDALPRHGKAGGAYDTAFPMVRESRVFTNFTGDYSSVATLAHELGHAFHDSLVMDKPALLSSYPMTLAETASIFSEQLLFQSVLKDASASQSLTVIESFVSDASQVCVDILSRFYFEYSLFEERKKGEVSANRLSLLMKDAQERTYGDAVEDKHELMWAVKSHYYSADFSFYNYPYAFGQLFALSLFSKAQKDSSFKDSYRSLLSVTGCMSADDVALSAGCDIRTVDFWKEGINVIAGYIRRLEDFAR